MTHCLCTVISLLLLLLLSLPAVAQPQRILVQPDEHLAFARALTRAALDAAGYQVTFVDAPLCNEPRKIALLRQGRTHLDLMPATPERLELAAKGEILMLPVPLDRGLLGYRLNLLLESDKDLLQKVSNVEGLRSLTIGQGEGWRDVELYRAAGIPTKEVKEWRNAEFVPQMQSGFFQLFPLGLEEALSYFLPHFRKFHPELQADPYILIRYPWFRFVWISPKAKGGAQLYEALEAGFETIAQNGMFLKVYKEHKPPLHADEFLKRRIVELENPFYDDSLVPPQFRQLLFAPGE